MGLKFHNQIDCNVLETYSVVRNKSLKNCKCFICEVESCFGVDQYKINGASVDLCPLCFSSQNLDVAGDAGSGVMIWLPEFTQTELNLTVTTIFATIIMGVDSGFSVDHIERLKSLYRTLESRSAPIKSFFGGAKSEKLFDQTSPLFIAQQIMQAKVVFPKKIALDNQYLDKKIDGLRFLANAKNFYKFYKSVGEKIKNDFSHLNANVVNIQEDG